jgi:23S rRNA pseudouridine2604 synthase
MKKELTYPARINKYLAHNNFCTRRDADELIRAGRVKINGRVAVLGDKVSDGDDVVVEKSGRKNKKLVYLAFNKPKGIVTHSPEKGQKAIANILKYPQKVFPIGRLDKDSHGLIILTNDGRITDRMLNPDFYHEKEYKVEVDRTISPSFITRMANCVTLEDGYTTRKCQVQKIDNLNFSIILTEGKKHQIRRMCEKLDRRVTDLRRDRIMNIKLDKLKPREYREIVGRELDDFLKNMGLNE